MIGIYRKLAECYNWSLNDIDNSDFETLIEFIAYKPESGRDTQIIGGKIYTRTNDPTWL